MLGLLMVGYAGIAILIRLQHLRGRSRRERLDFFAQSVLALAPAFCIAYLLMIAAWPWSALAPLNPLRRLIDFGQFHYQIRTLFNGHIYEMADVPRWYVPGYLAIKLPLLVLFGVVTAFLFVTTARQGVAPARSSP